MVERMPRRAIEDALRALGTAIDYGPVPDVSRRVQHAIGERPPARAALLRRPAIAVAAVTLAAVALVASLPASRDAVARALRIGGIKIEFGPAPSATPRTPIEHHPINLFLGRPTTLAAASHAVDFHVFLPDTALVGLPDRIFYSTSPPGGRVSLAYAPNDELPEAQETGYGMLVTEFESRIDADFVKKLITGGATVTDTSVDGSHAYWIEGTHFYMYRDANGRIRQDIVRLAANTLIWERAGVTLRIESSLSESRALEIARSMI